MFRFPKLGIVLAVFVVLMAAKPAVATDYAFSSPMTHVESGTISGTEVGDLSLGAYTGPIDADIDPATGIISNGTATLDFGGGNTLSITFEGQIFPDGSVAGTFTFVDGTGALAGASGSGTFMGTFNPFLGTFDTDNEGTLTLPCATLD
jgi:hypothetical protein